MMMSARCAHGRNVHVHEKQEHLDMSTLMAQNHFTCLLLRAVLGGYGLAFPFTERGTHVALPRTRCSGVCTDCHLLCYL